MSEKSMKQRAVDYAETDVIAMRKMLAAVKAGVKFEIAFAPRHIEAMLDEIESLRVRNRVLIGFAADLKTMLDDTDEYRDGNMQDQ